MYKNLSFSCNLYKFDVYFMQIRGREMKDYIISCASALVGDINEFVDCMKFMLGISIIILFPVIAWGVIWGICKIFNYY